MIPPNVFIVLASCDGEKYVAEQVESLQAQSFPGWRLLVHDDLSIDGTVERVRQLAANDDRIELLPARHAQRLGPAANFGFLLDAARERGADVVFPCDQDDHWKPHKVASLLDLLDQVPRDTPALAYADLEVGDACLNIRHPSLMRLQGDTHVQENALRTLLVQNPVAGCCCAANRALLDLALPIPASVRNFDWWLAASAAASGSFLFWPEALVTYRQHGANVVGALSYRSIARRPLGSMIRILAKHRALLAHNVTSLEELTRRLVRVAREDDSAVRELESFISIVRSPQGRLAKLRRLRRGGFWPQTWKNRVILFQSLRRDGAERQSR